MKNSSRILALLCAMFAVSTPLVAENLLDVVAKAREVISSYPNDGDRKLFSDELERIFHSDISPDKKIELIRSTFLSESTPKEPEQNKGSSSVPSQLIYRPKLQWSISPIEIAYDLDSETKILLSMERLYQEEERKSQDNSTGESTNKISSNGSRTQDETSASGSVQLPSSLTLNPLKWLQARVGYQWIKTDDSNKNMTNTFSSQWNERAQHALTSLFEEKVQILDNTRIRNIHLTFSISFKNNTDSILIYDSGSFSIPVYDDEGYIVNAVSDTPPREIKIYPNQIMDQMFRAELDTTKKVERLIKFMRSGAPLIRLDRGSVQIQSEDGTIRDAVQETIQNQAQTVPFRCRGFEMQIQKNNQGKATTVAEAMRAINAVFENAPFGFNPDGECVSLLDIPLAKSGSNILTVSQLPIIEIDGVFTSMIIPATQLSRPLSDDGLSIDILDIHDEKTWKEASPQLQAHFVPFLKSAAESGDLIACCQLGDCFYLGKGVEKDYSEAVKWYQKAAEQGNSPAQFNLAICYKNGYGCKQDITKAAQYCRMSAEQGKSEAQYELGNYYYSGSGVKQDYKDAFSWYWKAAEQNFSNAQCALGDCYYNGAGVERNYSSAIEWYSKAANQGHVVAQSRLEKLLTSNRPVDQTIRANVNTVSNIKGRFPEEYKAAQRIRNSNPAAYRNMMHELHRRLNTNR